MWYNARFRFALLVVSSPTTSILLAPCLVRRSLLQFSHSLHKDCTLLLHVAQSFALLHTFIKYCFYVCYTCVSKVHIYLIGKTHILSFVESLCRFFVAVMQWNMWIKRTPSGRIMRSSISVFEFTACFLPRKCMDHDLWKWSHEARSKVIHGQIYKSLLYFSWMSRWSKAQGPFEDSIQLQCVWMLMNESFNN